MRLGWILPSFLADQEGGTAVEYALLITGIATVIAAGVLAFGNAVLNMYTQSTSQLPF